VLKDNTGKHKTCGENHFGATIVPNVEPMAAEPVTQEIEIDAPEVGFAASGHLIRRTYYLVFRGIMNGCCSRNLNLGCEVNLFPNLTPPQAESIPFPQDWQP
jgi:hypothetical protein